MLGGIGETREARGVRPRTDPFGGTHIDATGVKVTDKEVTAETANFAVTYPSFNVKLTVKGYKRQRAKEDDK